MVYGHRGFIEISVYIFVTAILESPCPKVKILFSCTLRRSTYFLLLKVKKKGIRLKTIIFSNRFFQAFVVKKFEQVANIQRSTYLRSSFTVLQKTLQNEIQSYDRPSQYTEVISNQQMHGISL